LFPLLVAGVLLLVKDDKVRGGIVTGSAILIAAGSIVLAVQYLSQRAQYFSFESPVVHYAALGIDVRARRTKALALSGAFAGIAGGLFAYSKGGVAPDALAIPRSVDALVMLLLGGQNALFGPLLGASVFGWLQDVLARATEYWRAAVGVGILVIVSLFPYGIGGAAVRVRGPR
jgi:MFS family permease